MRFQQNTGPVMAKGVEDTVFYNYNRLVALNEVGGDPGRFGIAPAEVPRGMPRDPAAVVDLDDRHDHPRHQAVARTSGPGSRCSRRSPGRGPRRSSAGPSTTSGTRPAACPTGTPNTCSTRSSSAPGRSTSTGRRPTCSRRPARPRPTPPGPTPNEAYEEALKEFVAGLLGDREFVADLEGFVEPLIEPGRVNSLSQALIKLTAPGVPDIYQGNELWDLSLVDPDNRRPVDYEVRRKLLAELAGGPTPEAILGRSDEGLPKLWLTRQALHLRRRRPELFGPEGDYTPIEAKGPKADHVVAFGRGDGCVTVAARLPLRLARRLGRDDPRPPRGPMDQ